MAQFNFNYKGKNFNIDAEICDNYFSRARGIMFRKKSKPLLFLFDKLNRQAIHSFFCIPFIAIWFDEKKIIDIRYVKPWKISLKPKEKFNKLLEIPEGDVNFGLLKVLIQK
ncbi:MAG: DUF192 domain-containing protein [Candidatus Nanoarchaeia archaeon]|nr:DUF192 domain-containing protein [Candidatus Nanoarchaeia archaeon]